MQVQVRRTLTLIAIASIVASSLVPPIASQECPSAKHELQRLRQEASQLHEQGKHKQALAVAIAGLKLSAADSHMLALGGLCHLALSGQDPDNLEPAKKWFADATRLLEAHEQLPAFDLARGRFHLLAANKPTSRADGQRQLKIAEACFSSLLEQEQFVYLVLQDRIKTRIRMGATAAADKDARRFFKLNKLHIKQLVQQANSTQVPDFRRALRQQIETAHQEAHVVRARLGRHYWRSGDRVQAAKTAAQLIEMQPQGHPVVAEFLAEVMPDDARTIPAHAFRLKHADTPLNRAAAALSLARCNPEGTRALPALLAALGDADLLVIREVVTALGMIKKHDEQSIRKLKQLREHKDKQVATRAKAALKRARGH